VSEGGSNRVNRGGSWNNNASNLRSANRNNNSPDNRNNNLGFRLASTGVLPELHHYGVATCVISCSDICPAQFLTVKACKAGNVGNRNRKVKTLSVI